MNINRMLMLATAVVSLTANAQVRMQMPMIWVTAWK